MEIRFAIKPGVRQMHTESAEYPVSGAVRRPGSRDHFARIPQLYQRRGTSFGPDMHQHELRPAQKAQPWRPRALHADPARDHQMAPIGQHGVPRGL